MSENNEDEISIEIKTDSSDKSKKIAKNDSKKTKDDNKQQGKPSYEELEKLLQQEKEKAKSYEDKLKLALADFQNLKRKIQSDIENEINNKFDKFMLDFLQIYDDFLRAKDSYEKDGIDTKGLDSILKNMDSLMSKYNVVPIHALGEIFDPRLHEAISIVEDPTLDENTITKELRKGYISHDRVIRPTLVEISKKSNLGE